MLVLRLTRFSRHLRRKCSLDSREPHRLVVVSEYWWQYFSALGFTNLELISDAFALNDYEISRYATDDFKARYGLTEKPIIYLGQQRSAQGSSTYPCRVAWH